MVEVRLHGALARDYGRIWNLDIATPREAVAAINCGRPGFAQRILELGDDGAVFRVRTKAHDYGNDDLDTTLGSQARMDIIPIICGSSAGARFAVGAALVASVFFTGGTSMALIGSSMLKTVAFQSGVGLMMGSVAEWLSPVKRKDNSSTRSQSWDISGPTNTVDQGSPVPVIYGEVLTGAYPISGGVVASTVTPGGTLSPSLSIGGQNSIAFSSGGSTGIRTVVVRLTVGSINLAEPWTWAWSRSGFAAAAAVRLVTTNTATLQMELDYLLSSVGQIRSDTGTVSVTMTGKSTVDGVAVTGLSASTTVNVTVDSLQPHQDNQ
jgi:predicted phage tail protein